jgi:hypothetical protein
MMGEREDAARALSRNLHEAVERVRRDVERVEFWADAVAGFSQPVPDYDRTQGKVWLPGEQATALGPKHESKKNKVNPEPKAAAQRSRRG